MDAASQPPLTAEDLVSQQTAFRVWQVARSWRVTANHVVNLIESGELKVPPENIRAPKTMISIPRANLVAFIAERMSPEWFAARKAEKEARKLASASKLAERSHEPREDNKRFCTSVPAFCTSTEESPSHRKRRLKT